MPGGGVLRAPVEGATSLGAVKESATSLGSGDLGKQIEIQHYILFTYILTIYKTKMKKMYNIIILIALTRCFNTGRRAFSVFDHRHSR